MMVTRIKEGVGEITLPRWIAVGAITLVLSGSAAWWTSMGKLDRVAASVEKMEPVVERVEATERDIAIIKHQLASQADIASRIGALELIVARQTAILERLEQSLVRLGG